MEVMTIEYQATPFRAGRFQELYSPVAARVLDYGAKGYALLRSEDDPDHFVHVSYWEDRSGFQRWWLSREMQKARQDLAGLYSQPLATHWNYLVAEG